MRDGWSKHTLGEIVTIINGGTPSTKIGEYWGGEIVWITTTELTAFDGKRVNSSKRTITQDGLNSGPARMVRAGTTLVGTTATIGTCAMAACDLTFNQQISGLLPKTNKLDDGFLFYWIQFAKPILEGLAAGTSFKRISTSVLKTIEVKLPPLSEQKRIVDLISSVDSYIEALQLQLESAQKSRNAVLHQLLTTGGDDWVETTLGEVALLNPSEPALSDTAHFAPMDAVHVGKRWLQYTEERRDRNGARARAGDVLFARITPCLENGKVAQVQSELERCGGSTEFIVVRGTEKCTSDFLYFWCTLKVNRDKAAELMTGTTGRQRLSWQGLGSLSLWLPSIAEQDRIVNNISEFDSLIESTESAITKSQNLRSGLLSDLLSGEHEIPSSYDKVIGAA
jgi:restriction endonuclease S subunit